MLISMKPAFFSRAPHNTYKHNPYINYDSKAESKCFITESKTKLTE